MKYYHQKQIPTKRIIRNDKQHRLQQAFWQKSSVSYSANTIIIAGSNIYIIYREEIYSF